MTATSPQRPQAQPLARKSILIVEDDPTCAAVAEGVCRRLGARRLRTCASAAAALAALQDTAVHYDVVLLDMMLGDADGLSALSPSAERPIAAALVPVSGKDARILDAASRLLATRGLSVCPPVRKPLTAAKLVQSLASGATRHAAAPSALPQPDHATLRAALSAGELEPWFQPSCDLRTGAVLGVEMLARWRHGDGRLILPQHFIAGMEETGLIGPATELLMARAAGEIACLRAGGEPLGLGVNLAPRMLTDPELPDRLAELARAHGLPPRLITLEITESAIAREPLSLLDAMTRLRLRGFQLALDDFGTGASTLEQLRDLPFSELKIDRGFVTGAALDDNRRVILDSVTVMAKRLGLRVVAEGVETQQDLAVLRELPVDRVQGWLLGHPVDGAALHARLAAERPPSAP